MKKLFIASLIFIMCISLYGCKKEKNENLKFVTSCYPIYIMTLNIIDNIEGVEVVNMSENHQGCLHDFQLQSEDLKRIEKSSAFIINGAGMESFLNKVLNELPKVKIIDSSENIELIEEDECHCEHHETEHCHHEYNPHIWTSVSNYIKQVENISGKLIELDPAHSEQYRKNTETYVAKLNQLKSIMSTELMNVKNKDIITFHEAFPYFANEFGLNIVSVISHDPENEPSAKELSETIDTVKSLNIKALFVEPQYPSTSAQVISKETGANIYVLDPAATGENSKDSYIKTMYKNLESLKTALN